MANNLIDVATYQRADLALLQNQSPFISLANKKFKDFDQITTNLGDTVTFDKPVRSSTVPSLIADFQPVTQRVQSLTVDKEISSASEYTNPEMIFNVEQYVKDISKSKVAEISWEIESSVAQLAIDNTYRFYGSPTTPLNSYGQLAEMLMLYRNYGSPKHDIRGILPDSIVPGVINSGLNQFALNRNNEDAMSWELGSFSKADWYESNLLPLHTAGVLGNAGTTMTFVSISTDGKTLTLSGSPVSQVGAVKKGDVFEFADGATSPALRYLTFIGHKTSANKVQFRSDVDADADGAGNVVLTVTPALIFDGTNVNPARNLNRALDVTDTCTALADHRAGLLYGGDALFMAMPRLPNEVPFPTANEVDPDTGASLRLYYGSKFGMNQRGFVHDAIHGETLVDEFAMRIVTAP